MHGVLRHIRRSERRRLFEVLTDAELLARFLAERDETAFEELIHRHGPMVRAVCRRVLGPTADADDAFQAAFLILIRKARSIRRTDLLANWLCAVAYRTSRQALRRRYRIGVRERIVDPLPETGCADEPPRDWLPLFDAALQRLPSKYRDPVVLCELQGLSRPEAARKLGVNEGTLSSRLGRARDLLRKRLTPHGFPLVAGAALAPSLVPEALTASTAAASMTIGSASVSAIVLTEGVLTAMFASKVKAGAACAAVLLVGTIAGFQFSGSATLAGGPAAKEAPKAAPKTEPTSEKPSESKSILMAAEYEPFQGDWSVTAAERDGIATTPAGVGVDETWKFASNVLTTGGEAKEDAGSPFKIDPRAKPAEIDFTLIQFRSDNTGSLVPASYQGIYRFDPDGRLIICFRPSADRVVRPSRFATARNSGATLVKLRRLPPPAPQHTPIALDFGVPIVGNEKNFSVTPVDPGKTKPADLAQVVGASELTDVDGLTPEAAIRKLSVDRDGNPAPAGRAPRRWESLRRMQLLPAGGPMDLTNHPNSLSFVAYFELDGTRNPKWITFHALISSRPDAPAPTPPTKIMRLCGIYKVEGEKLVLCLPEAEVSPLLRPAEFKSDGEDGVYVLTYKRAAKNWKPDVRVTPPPTAADSPPIVPAIKDDERKSVPETNVPVPTPVAPAVIPPTPAAQDLGKDKENPTLLPRPDSSVPTLDLAPPGPPPAVAGPTAPVVPSAAPAPPPNDLDRLQGSWALKQ